jgi:hypothetical protein
MPTRITHFLHDNIVAPDVPPALGTAFAAADVHVHDLTAALPDFQKNKANFRGIVEGIHIRVENIAGGAAKVTMRLCADADGDFVLVPDTEADIAVGLTTADSGCVAFKVGLPIFQVLGGPGNGELFLFAKLDAGTADYAQSCITWTE